MIRQLQVHAGKDWKAFDTTLLVECVAAQIPLWAKLGRRKPKM